MPDKRHWCLNIHADSVPINDKVGELGSKVRGREGLKEELADLQKDQPD